jgi:heat shock protein HslJ
MRHLTILSIALALVASLAAVGTAAAVPARQNGLPAEMIGTTWNLVAFQQAGTAVDVQGGGLTVVFDAEGRVSGSSGCNNFTGSYTAGSGQQLTIGPLASTLMLCTPDSVNTREHAYQQALQAVTAYTLSAPGQLELTSPQDTLSYTSGASANLPATGAGGDTLALGLGAFAALALLAGLALRRAGKLHRA